MLKIIPQPREIKYTSDEIVKLDHFKLGQSRLNKRVTDDFIRFVNLPDGKENVTFTDNSAMSREAYRLTIADKITVEASSFAGELYALETLKQIIFQSNGELPQVEINDCPEYKIRGFMLDVGRYFFPVSDVKTFLDRMAMHKLNLMHFHLTEDQGWRIQIDRYPKLTEIGSMRKRTNFNHKPHGGFYTKDEIREIVEYAQELNIEIMPEFDIPSHSRAAIAAYPELSCFPRDLPVADHWGVKHDVLCVGKDDTITFVKNVIDELCELFPAPYFHIGGDEVPKHRWDLCPHCQAKIKKLGLKDSEELQCNFMNEIKDYCGAKGKQVFMWSWDLEDESLLDNDLGFTLCGDKTPGGRPFIDTNASAYYIDLPYGYISLKDTADHKVTDGNCLGVEVTLWTEYVPHMKKADRMTYPRLGAMSEKGWNGNCSWAGFKEKSDYYYSYLSRHGIGYSLPKTANPSKLRGKVQGLLFERRQLAWEGLHNLIDDRIIEVIAKKNR